MVCRTALGRGVAPLHFTFHFIFHFTFHFTFHGIALLLLFVHAVVKQRVCVVVWGSTVALVVAVPHIV